MMSSSGLRFYREVRRALRKLPPNAQDYYAVVAREKFVAHRDEDDAARVHVRTHVRTLRSARFDAGSLGDDADSRGSGRRRRRRRAVVRVQEVSRHRQVRLQGL